MTDVLVPGGRDVRGSLDRASEAERGDADAEADPDTDACVVACPPHPQHRGHRGDERLRAVSDVLTAGGVDCLRFDYGDWDEGYGERADARNAVAWAGERYERVGLFGFSFGGCLALQVASEGDADAVSALAPTARLADDLDAVAAMDDLDCPAQVVFGTRDDTADWEPVVERARELGFDLREFSADHFFVGQAGKVGDAVGEWLLGEL
ncbi:dienelactone hydrolase family protein [Halobaculum roseum]|uniref:Dienelactone hydrolase family protein n=1 Tax=Halobaculum roseum TaxID=2175149 RepID=A0ABD5MMT0_9EURY|nr:dienelactone hydrolase family protein [Halobaculum roseum]QZY03843.1 dienelactone hydrolase family protein [Halobaculum roseum]